MDVSLNSHQRNVLMQYMVINTRAFGEHKLDSIGLYKNKNNRGPEIVQEAVRGGVQVREGFQYDQNTLHETLKNSIKRKMESVM